MKSISNRRIVAAGGPDFYPTPAWATRALLAYETFEGQIWEPACGRGAISRVLLDHGYKVISSDLNNWGYGKTPINFLQQTCRCDNIFTNPPYNVGSEFVLHALKLARRKTVMLVRLAFLESVKRYVAIYSSNPPSRVYIFSQRLSMYAEGAPVKGGGTTAYGWFVWDREHTGRTELHWIKPGFKDEI